MRNCELMKIYVGIYIFLCTQLLQSSSVISIQKRNYFKSSLLPPDVNIFESQALYTVQSMRILLTQKYKREGKGYKYKSFTIVSDDTIKPTEKTDTVLRRGSGSGSCVWSARQSRKQDFWRQTNRPRMGQSGDLSGSPSLPPHP